MNPHLNIFKFFGGENKEYLEDNLSRGFALCLKHDPVFLDRVLQQILSAETYDDLFGTEFPDWHFEVDLQTRVTDVAPPRKIIGVACSGIELDAIDTAIARITEFPETDVSLRVKDICILFEFKRTSEDCRAQLKRQVERLKEICGDDVETDYENLDWSTIVRILTSVGSFRQQIRQTNPFTSDFLRFVEIFNVGWFPRRLLKNIPFALDPANPNYHFLNNRLDEIKKGIYGEDHIVEKKGTYKRLALSVDFGWINEINISPVIFDGNNMVCLTFHFGDTKGQGKEYFGRRPTGIAWQNEPLGFRSDVILYLKISDAYGSAILWICPTPEQSQSTHTQKFFDEFAGKWEREEWPEFERTVAKFIPDWKDRCFTTNELMPIVWDAHLTDTDRTRFLLSVGTFLRVFVPYQACQDLDDDLTSPQITRSFRSTIEEVKERIDGIPQGVGL